VVGVRYDLVVVGAGAVGAVTAWRAHAENPGWRVLLADQARPGDGATGLAGGLVVPTAATAAHAALVRAGADAWTPLARGVPGVRHAVKLLVVVSRRRRAELDATTVGAPFADATREDIRLLERYYPDLVVRDDEVVLTAGHRAWTIDGRQLTESLARWVAARGTFWSGAEAVAAEPCASGIRIGFRSGREVEAPRVVEATGPWIKTGALLPGAGRDIRLKQVAALHLEAGLRADSPGVLFHDDDLYVLPPTPHRPALVSFYRDRWLEPREGWARPVDGAALEQGRQALGARSATLAGAVVGGRTFADAYAADRLPVVRGAEWPGGVVAGAGSGSGIRLAPGMAKRALELLGAAGPAGIRLHAHAGSRG
jgi:D-arginine dehydrogenase